MKLEKAFEVEEVVLEDEKTKKKSIRKTFKPKYSNGKIFAPLKNKYLEPKPEEVVRQNFICGLINDYGYSLEQMSQEEKVTNSLRGTGAARADIVIWKTPELKRKKKAAFLVIELKADNLTLKIEDCYQGYNYATWSRAKLFAASNGKELQVYEVIEEELPLKLKLVRDIPKAKDILDEDNLNIFLAETKEFTGDEFAKLLHKCHNIIRNNDKLSPEASFDEISKILFIKILYERNPSQDAIFSLKQFEKMKEAWNLINGQSESSYIQRAFEDVKREYKKDSIFDENENIKLRERSFELIVKELEIYNLTSTSADVKGIAFERFLGRTFRGELGQFFTPRAIVDFIVDLLEPSENELICDPCAGSGGFLIKTFESIKKTIDEEFIGIKNLKQQEIFGENFEKIDDENCQSKYEAFLVKANKTQEKRIKKLSHETIYGTDANPRMARVSKMNMIMHGDGHNGIHHNDGLLNVNGIFRNRFDVIITNPPFGANLSLNSPTVEEDDKYTNKDKIKDYVDKYGEEYLQELKQVTDNINVPIRKLFQVGATSGATEVLFIERCLDLLKPGGRMGIVLPEGVLNSSNLQSARELFESRARVLLIVSLPQEIFISSGATVKTSLVFFKKFTVEEEKQFDAIKRECKNLISNSYKNEIERIKAPLEEITLKSIKIKELIKNTKTNKKQKEEDKPGLDELKAKEKLLISSKKIALNEEKKKLKLVNEQMAQEIKDLIKERFDYEIPISDIKSAGITSTGAQGENELPELLELFKAYRIQQCLWEVKK